jgi:phage/plasmid-associated DNA primase
MSLSSLPVASYLEDNDILCYSAQLVGEFKKEKGRVGKTIVSTCAVKDQPGTWDKSCIRRGDNAIMMRAGSRVEGDAQMNSGFIVVDLDVRGDEVAEQAFPELWALLTPLCSCVVRTTSGGVHLYWKVPAGKSWTKETNIDKMVIDGKEYNCDGRVDVLANGVPVILPGSSFTYQNVPFTYTYEKGSLEDASLLPAILIDAFDGRDKMSGRKGKPPRSAEVPPARLPAVPAGSPPSTTSTPSRPTTPSRITDDDLKILDRLCDCLTPDWLDKYSNWRDLVFGLKAVTQGRSAGRELLLRHTTRSPRHRSEADADATRKLWDTADVKGTIGWGSLHYWAKLCSPDKHHAIFKDNYSRLIHEGNRGLCDIYTTELAGACVYMAEEKVFWMWIEHMSLWKPVCEDNIVAHYMRHMPQVIQKLIIAHTARRIGDGDDAWKEELMRLRKQKESAGNAMPEPVMKCLRDSLNPQVSYRNIDAFELDANPDYFPLANGVWNFRENRLEDYTRQHYISKRLPICYNAKADTSNIREAMRLWFKGNQEHIDFVQYWFGYGLTGHITRQDFLVLHGKSAGNGKSTWVEEILQNDIMGREFCSTLGEDALTKVGGNNDDLYYAFGKRLVIAPEGGNESRDTKAIHMPTIKRITGGGRVVAEAKFKGKKEGAFTAKVVTICNEMLKLPSTIDAGTRRRILAMKMDVKFVSQGDWDALSPEEQASGDFGLRNPAFIKALRANKEGTLLWLLQGARRYMEEPDMDAPESVKAYTDEALAQADAVRLWLMDGYEFHKSWKREQMPFKDIANAWCEAHGVKPTHTQARANLLKKIRAWVGESNVTGDSNHGYTIHCFKQKPGADN